MKKLAQIVVYIIPLLSLQAEDGFHVYEHPGRHDLPQIPKSEFTVHQHDRPQPRRIQPPATNGELGLPPASDATSLFNGKGLDQFKETTWQVVDGNIVAGKMGLATKANYANFQLHVEWRTPADPTVAEHPGNMGNSGLYIMGRYELQIYDSYSSRIYADGSAASIYGQTPPLVNVCRKPGEWQSYDIEFTAPTFENDLLVSPARITVLHNGVLVQNHTEIVGPTKHNTSLPYTPHAAKGPIVFQGHDSPVQYRNIWIREL